MEISFIPGESHSDTSVFLLNKGNFIGITKGTPELILLHGHGLTQQTLKPDLRDTKLMDDGYTWRIQSSKRLVMSHIR